MRTLKIVNFTENNGHRTSINLSEVQIEVVDKIAQHYKKTRSQYLADLVEKCSDTDRLNLSNYVRDKMFCDIIMVMQK